ncbi:hypothetical protein BC629DRAFT_1597036 [Irpex lacteus]|nr:hypothetical protein BC629DRAFT_1597036 [Irpex lacteus]
MEVINLILAVVVMLTQLSRVPFSFPDVYHLAVAGVETAVCGPPAVSSYLALICGTLDVARLPATPAVVVNVFPSAVLAGFHDASVFDPSFTGCLVNCTVVEPAPIYFGPFFPAADVIVAPKFALLAPPAPRVPPVCPPWEKPPMTLLEFLKSLCTWENLGYLTLAISASVSLWRSYTGRLSPDLLDNVVYGRLDSHCGSILEVLRASLDDDLSDFVRLDEPVAKPEVAIPVQAQSIEEPVVDAVKPKVDDVPGQEEPVDVASLELPEAPKEEPVNDVPVDDNQVDEEVEHPLSPPEIESVDELQVELEVSGVITSDDALPHHAPPETQAQVVDAALIDEAQVAGDVASHIPSTKLPDDVIEAISQLAVVPKVRVGRSGRKCKALARKREREAAAAAAAAAGLTEAPAQEPELAAEPVEVTPAPRPARHYTAAQRRYRTENRARRGRERAARHQEALQSGPSRIVEEPEAPTPLFTDADFPPLPVEPVAVKHMDQKMSYALVTAVSPPSKTAVVYDHSLAAAKPSTTASAYPDPEPERPQFKWVAASRRYEDVPRSSTWTNWTLDLEDIAIVRPSKRITKQQKKD